MDNTPLHLEEEKRKLEEMKAEFELKSKQIWAMSEAAYKEKKKADEQLKELLKEKEQLENQRKDNEDKVKLLWQQSSAIHHEKERINELRVEIESRHKEIMDSVLYAKLIQEAILPDDAEFHQAFPDSFVFFRPRNIVSGDFYWMSVQGDLKIIAQCDCTGHGVPGAFMSMIGNTLLNQIVNEKKNFEPEVILLLLNKEINRTLKQTREGSESRDGMDVALCVYDFKNKIMKYAGANRPLYHFRLDPATADYELNITKASKFPIGGYYKDQEKIFEAHTLPLQAGDTFYIFSDGYADQFGGANGKKFMLKTFQNLLSKIMKDPAHEQARQVEEALKLWQGDHEQVDDITVIGIRVPLL